MGEVGPRGSCEIYHDCLCGYNRSVSQRAISLIRSQNRCLVCHHEQRQQIETTMLRQGLSIKERCQMANEAGFRIPYYSYLRHWKRHPLICSAMQIDKNVQEQTLVTMDQFLDAAIEAGYNKVSAKPESVSVRDAITATKVKSTREQFQEKSDTLRILLMQYMSGEKQFTEELAVIL